VRGYAGIVSGFARPPSILIKKLGKRQATTDRKEYARMVMSRFTAVPWTRLIAEPVQSLGDKPTTPLAEGARHDMEPSRDHLAVPAFSTCQYDSCSARDRRGPIAIDVPASPIGAVRLRSRSAQPWGVPFACSPTRRAYERAALFVSVFMVTAH